MCRVDSPLSKMLIFINVVYQFLSEILCPPTKFDTIQALLYGSLNELDGVCDCVRMCRYIISISFHVLIIIVIGVVRSIGDFSLSFACSCPYACVCVYV